MDVTLQRLLQLVSPSFQRWVETGNCFSNSEFLLAAEQKGCETTSCKKDVTLYNA